MTCIITMFVIADYQEDFGYEDDHDEDNGSKQQPII